MKLYENQLREDDGVIVCDHLNQSNKQVAELFNAQVGTDNLPINTLDKTKFPFLEVISSQQSNGEFCQYFSKYSSGSDFRTPILTVSLAELNLQAGWNDLNSLGISQGALEDLTLQTGLIRGEIVVDFERRYGYNGVLFLTVEGDQNYVDFGIFVDNQLVANTGPIYPRRFTLTLPWLYPITTGSHNFEIRFRYSSNELNLLNAEVLQTFNVFTLAISGANYLR